MLNLGKLTGSTFRLVLPALVPGVLLAVVLGQYKKTAAPMAVPLANWDIPRLVTYLREEGLDLHLVATQQNGIINQTAYLTATTKDFRDFNRMPKSPTCIDLWEGSLYCERGRLNEFRGHLVRQWGDCCLVAEPFIFFGDRKLLDRVGAALSRV